MKDSSWEFEFDDDADLSEGADIFGADESGIGQIEFSEHHESDLEAGGNMIEQNTSSVENVNASDSSSETAEPESATKERESMSDFNSAIANAVSNIPECLAAGVVDMDSGMLLGVKTVDSHPQEVLDMLAAATQDLFQGQNVVTIENTFKKARGLELDDYHYFKEIIVNSENLIHVFIRGKQHPQYVMTFVCRLSANLGMVLTKARGQVPLLEAAI